MTPRTARASMALGAGAILLAVLTLGYPGWLRSSSRPLSPQAASQPTNAPLSSALGGPLSQSDPSATGGPSSPGSSGTAALTELAISAAHLNLVVFSLPTINPDGSIGANHDAFHSVGFQRPFGNHVVSAVVKQDAGELSSAIKAIEFCYEHQNADGSFQVVQVPGATYSLNTDPVVGTAFFYADLGHALALLQDSHWFQTDASTTSLRQRLEALRPGIARGLNWLSAPAQYPTVQNTGNHDTNRETFAAEAFLLTGRWLRDDSAVANGEGLLHRAEGNLEADGTILEKGGFDSGYQSVSLTNLLHVYFHLPSSAEAQRPALWNMIVRGTAREEQAILPTGEISHTANSRTYCGGESFRGKQKQSGGDDVVRTLVYMSGLTRNASLLNTAQAVVDFYATNPHDLCAVP